VEGLKKGRETKEPERRGEEPLVEKSSAIQGDPGGVNNF